MSRTSDPMTVELVPHLAWDDKATIPGWIEFDQYLVYVHSEGLAHRNKDKKLQVGIIGKQAGANFCPIPELDSFTYAHRVWIAEEAKRLHGNASPLPFVEVPPLVNLNEEAEDEESDTEPAESHWEQSQPLRPH